MKKKWSLLQLLLVIALVKGVVMSLVVPLWEFPDEQAHLGQVAYMNETHWRVPWGDNLSREIAESERVMGTYRDENGINQFTYHPEHKHEFSQGLYGPKEKFIQTMPRAWRSEYVGRESSLYPSLFYLLSSIGYRLVYNRDLIMRVFFTRMVSVLLHLVMVWVAWKLGREVFRKKQLPAVVMASAVVFQPMFSFVVAGVNNDNLTNLVGLVLVWMCVRWVRVGLTRMNAIGLAFIAGIGMMSKPLIFPLLLGVGGAVLVEWLKSKRALKNELVIWGPMLVVGIALGGWDVIRRAIVFQRVPYFGTLKPGGDMSLTFGEYIGPQIGRYYRETLVWYWGVYKWLGLNLPLGVIRGIKVVMLAAGAGLVKVLIVGKGEYKWKLVVMAVITLIYVVSLTFWDYVSVKNNGVTHGLQGRYFFPAFGAHMGLILAGLVALVPKKLERWLMKGLVVGLVYINMVSVKVLVVTYYSTETMQRMFYEMSQYKPWFLKFPYSVVWIVMYLGLVAVFGWSVLRQKER